MESGENTSETGLLEDLRLIGYMLEAGNMAELLQGAFQCAWPGFSTEFAKALLSSPPLQASHTTVKIFECSSYATPCRVSPVAGSITPQWRCLNTDALALLSLPSMSCCLFLLRSMLRSQLCLWISLQRLLSILLLSSCQLRDQPRRHATLLKDAEMLGRSSVI